MQSAQTWPKVANWALTHPNAAEGSQKQQEAVKRGQWWLKVAENRQKEAKDWQKVSQRAKSGKKRPKWLKILNSADNG